MFNLDDCKSEELVMPQVSKTNTEFMLMPVIEELTMAHGLAAV